jgi:hypothetical protein
MWIRCDSNITNESFKSDVAKRGNSNVAFHFHKKPERRWLKANKRIFGGFMYQFKDEINYTNFFRFNKVLVTQRLWASLPKASKSVYPVILVHCDARGTAFPGQETIAILSGRTEKTVREGIKGLEGFPDFEAYQVLTGRGHWSYRYKINITPDEKGRSFSLYKCLFESGYWSKLSSCAHSLYIVMRTFSFFDGYLYCELENLDDYEGYEVDKLIEKGIYQERNYDFVNAEVDVLAEFAGISSAQGFLDAINSLKENHLIEPTESIDGLDTWKIFRIPQYYLDRDWLNDLVKKRYVNRETVNSN